jgi:Cytoskeletal adhesion
VVIWIDAWRGGSGCIAVMRGAVPERRSYICASRVCAVACQLRDGRVLPWWAFALTDLGCLFVTPYTWKRWCWLSGAERLHVLLERVVIHYRKPLEKPFFTISLHRSDGQMLEAPSDTPPGFYKKNENVIFLDHPVTLVTPLALIPHGQSPSYPSVLSTPHGQLPGELQGEYGLSICLALGPLWPIRFPGPFRFPGSLSRQGIRASVEGLFIHY